MKKCVTKLVAFTVMLVLLVMGVFENLKAESAPLKEIFITEDKYLDTMADVVETFLNQHRHTGYIDGAEQKQLYYEAYRLPGSIGTIIVNHGLGESLVKYNELTYYFLKKGYSVYGMEYRGQGRSGRMGLDISQLNVDDFIYYYKDLKKFIDEIVIPEEGKEKLYLFAHSMGGAVGARFLEEYPEYFRAAVLSSPMLDIKTGDIPDFIARLVAYGIAVSPWKDEYVVGNKPYSTDYNFEATHTHSRLRYERDWMKRNENIELQTEGISYHWLSEAYKTINAAIDKKNASKVKIPVMLCQAGEDALVGDAGQNQFAKYADNCKVVRYETAKHAIYYETDSILITYLENLFAFLEAN